jgi:transcription antitermination factor NusG
MPNGQMNEPKAWFALQVRSRWENAAEGLLQNKGFETFLPTYPATRRWSDRSKIVESPLFPGYVFCRFDIHDRLPVLITPGVISVVGRGKTPIAVAESEITALQIVIRSGIQTQPWPYLEIGERVRIKDDVLEGMEGILTSFKGHQRVIISVVLLQRSVALEIDRSRILRLSPARTTSADSGVALPRLGDVVA